MQSKTSSPAGRDAAKVMNRSDLTRRLVAKLKREEAVVGGIGNTHFDLWAAGQRPQNFYMLGSMGLAAPIALGVALAQPQRQVFALEGDGSLLMQLGALGTIAAVQPKNLAVIVWDNGAYQITGSQPTLTSRTVDLVAVAKGAGLAHSTWATDEAHFEALLDQALEGNGPLFICARTDNQPPAGVTERDAAKIRNRFMEGLRPSSGMQQPTGKGA
jgi:Thiamine pyrophosphate-requiring enzymes [acetolactate synthase, pyruvate dehydrogenase (cytochrome), glyoxylate carboligase, phosphonopyruvate decarboxylase]